MGLEGVQNIVLVLSGKGGVGKSSTTAQLALTLHTLGHTVGILDIDLTGPNIPRMFSLETSTVLQSPSGWLPVPVPHTSSRIRCMSLGFLLRSRGDSVVWRGPKKTAMVKQFLTDTVWGETDYLLVDTPPGTGDEHISLMEQMRGLERLRGAVVVTTPQAVATADVRKELNFCRKVGVRVLGVVENMAGFVCPHCEECTDVFSRGGGEKMSLEFGVGFLGGVPIDPNFVELVEGQGKVREDGTVGKMLVEGYKESKLAAVFREIAEKVVRKIEEGKEAAGGAVALA